MSVPTNALGDAGCGALPRIAGEIGAPRGGLDVAGAEQLAGHRKSEGTRRIVVVWSTSAPNDVLVEALGRERYVSRSWLNGLAEHKDHQLEIVNGCGRGSRYLGSPNLDRYSGDSGAIWNF